MSVGTWTQGNDLPQKAQKHIHDFVPVVAHFTLISIGERSRSANWSTYAFQLSADVIWPARSHAKPAQYVIDVATPGFKTTKWFSLSSASWSTVLGSTTTANPCIPRFFSTRSQVVNQPRA